MNTVLEALDAPPVTTRPLAPAAPAALAPAGPAAPRVDLYAPIHKALRHAMTHTLQRIGQADLHDDEDLRVRLAELATLLEMMASHLARENTYVHPLLDAAQPGSSQKIAHEHVEHQSALDALAAAADTLPRHRGAARVAAGLRLYRQLALFVAENMVHMDEEETRHNAVLWQHHDDAALHALHDTLVASIEPQEFAQLMPWFASGLAHHELAAMLGAMQAAMPPEPFRNVLALVMPRLSTPRWDKLARALGVPQVPGLVHVR